MNEHSQPSVPTSLPRVLLVEDDPVSAAYMADVVVSLPGLVDVAASIAEALKITGTHRHSLLLIDAHLPDGCGESLLATLRGRGIVAPALAHTASVEPQRRAELLASGFVEVLRKPLGIAELQQAMRRQLPQTADPAGHFVELPCWDDAAALAVLGGQRANVEALRGLFVAELPGQQHRIATACVAGNEAGVRDELHRLVASCGFVGAARLGQAVRKMQASPLDTHVLATLQIAIRDVLRSA